MIKIPLLHLLVIILLILVSACAIRSNVDYDKDIRDHHDRRRGNCADCHSYKFLNKVYDMDRGVPKSEWGVKN